MTRIKFNKPTTTRSGLTYQGVVLVNQLHPRKTAVIGIVWKREIRPLTWGWATLESFKSPDFEPMLHSGEPTRAKAAEMVRRSVSLTDYLNSVSSDNPLSF